MSKVKTPPFFITDFETGGFSSRENAITEFAAIVLDGDTLEELGRYEAIVAPYDDNLLYDPKALEATKISMSMIQSGVPFKTFMKELKAFIKRTTIHSGAKYKPIITGHNIPFDINFFQQIFEKDKSKIQDYFACNEDHFGNQYPKYIDSLTLAYLTWGNDPTMISHKLTDCVHKIGEEIVNAHRAMNDVEATATLVINYVKRMREQSQNTESVAVESAPRFRTEFKF